MVPNLSTIGGKIPNTDATILIDSSKELTILR